MSDFVTHFLLPVVLIVGTPVLIGAAVVGAFRLRDHWRAERLTDAWLRDVEEQRRRASVEERERRG